MPGIKPGLQNIALTSQSMVLNRFVYLFTFYTTQNFAMFSFQVMARFFLCFHKVLPQIVPFTFGEEEFNFDESVTATCSVSKGDLPIFIWWALSESIESQAEYNISTNDGIVITKASQKVSMLNIDAVKARHRGNYTCYARNKAGVAKQSAYLAING